MRSMLRTVAAVSVLCALALPVHAEDFGIDFAAMPVGCRWHTEYSNGNRWLSEYVGVRRGRYIIETTEDRRPRRAVSTSEYDGGGHLVRRTWADGKWEAFDPRSCFSVGGRCTHTYSNADGVNERHHSRVRRSGDGLTVTSGVVGGADFATDTVRPGPLGIASESRNRNFWVRVTAFEKCDLPQS